ncbi:hypothetical protein J6590_018215 [Homalodisca vitripennis]|nr:hypothetical protein J6590_018215 [Homalodisca vitripennis]
MLSIVIGNDAISIPTGVVVTSVLRPPLASVLHSYKGNLFPHLGSPRTLFDILARVLLRLA